MAGSDPAYLAYLLEHGTLLVAERDGSVRGFGATRLIGHGPAAVSMLCDLFVHPGTHGRGCGRATRTATCSWRPSRGCSTRGARCPIQAPPDVPGDAGRTRATCQNVRSDAMMLYVDKKMLHDSHRNHEAGQLTARARAEGHGARQYPHDGHAAPVTAHEQHRREILLRVVRISDALNQRLAL